MNDLVERPEFTHIEVDPTGNVIMYTVDISKLSPEVLEKALLVVRPGKQTVLLQKSKETHLIITNAHIDSEDIIYSLIPKEIFMVILYNNLKPGKFIPKNSMDVYVK